MPPVWSGVARDVCLSVAGEAGVSEVSSRPSRSLWSGGDHESEEGDRNEWGRVEVDSLATKRREAAEGERGTGRDHLASGTCVWCNGEYMKSDDMLRGRYMLGVGFGIAERRSRTSLCYFWNAACFGSRQSDGPIEARRRVHKEGSSLSDIGRSR